MHSSVLDYPGRKNTTKLEVSILQDRQQIPKILLMENNGLIS